MMKVKTLLKNSCINRGQLAKIAGCSRAAVAKWDVIPLGRVAAIANASGIMPEILRSDVAWNRDASGTITGYTVAVEK